MIISRTPLRMSFTGGGSDFSLFYRKFGGAVISTAINKYIYVTVNKKFDDSIRIAYSKNEEVSSIDKLEHPLVREAMGYTGIKGGIEITTVADIPSKGSGLGSSSAFTVGLLNVLNAYLGRYISNHQLAIDGCHVEIDLCRQPIGKQDQYASAMGGFNLIEFNPDDSVDVTPLLLGHNVIDRIKSNTLMFYTGITRDASTLLRKQSTEVRNDLAKQDVIREMVKLTYNLRDELYSGNLDAFGEILHENWVLKKRLSDAISTEQIDRWYEVALNSGAIGGKILGAGAGGFLLLYAPVERHDAIRQSLPTLRYIQIDFEHEGSKIIFRED